MAEIERNMYAALYGPTTGDRIRLADTALTVRVEADDAAYGDEILGGCGKTYREAMLATSDIAPASQLDMLISNVVVIDPVLGIRKTSIGVKDGRIAGIGRAGNPGVTDGIDLVAGTHTALVPGEGLIATAGIIDSHVHLSSPALAGVALSAGTTTMVGMGLGAVWDVGVNPERNLTTLLAGWHEVPVNISFLARGSALNPAPLERALETGASGFKVHEDFGAYPGIVDTCLTVADQHDVAVALHTDSLNESGMLADTVAATRGRTVHAYHVEGGGGHPDLLEVLSQPHVLASSTTPTVPLSVNTVDELFPMTMTVHRQSAMLPGDVAVSRSRIHRAGIQAENVLHDLGAVSVINSDSMGMGRVGEVARRTFQLASLNKQAGHGAAEHGAGAGDDNERVLRYVAKITINPAIAHGLAGEVGSLEPGKLADIVLWHPGFFGAKPEMVIKSGFVAWAVSGTGAGSTRLCQPRRYRSFFGGMGDAPARLSVLFAARAAAENGWPRRAGIVHRVVPVQACRGLTRAAMLRNTAIPQVRVPPDGSPVLIDGAPARHPAAGHVPLGQLYHLA